MNKRFLLITSISIKDKFLYAYDLKKQYQNPLIFDVRKRIEIHRFVYWDDVKGFIDYVYSFNNKCDAIFLFYPEKEFGLRKFLNKHYDEIPFSIVFVDSYYLNFKYLHEEIIAIRSKNFINFLDSFKDIPAKEIWNRIIKNKSNSQEEQSILNLFNVYLYVGGQKVQIEKLLDAYYSYTFSPLMVIKMELYSYLKRLMPSEDASVLDMVLNSICHSKLFLHFNHYKTRYSACIKYLKRLEFNGYVDIVERFENKPYKILQVVPQDIAYLASYLAKNNSIPMAGNLKSLYGMVQTFVINELKNYYDDVRFIKGYDDKKMIFAVRDGIFYLNCNINDTVPLTLANIENMKKFYLYNGDLRYDESKKIYYIPFQYLSFVLKELTERKFCKN